MPECQDDGAYTNGNGSHTRSIRIDQRSTLRVSSTLFWELASDQIVQFRSYSAGQCRGCGIFAPARMREQATSNRTVALPISLSENASSLGAISRLNQASSRWLGCSRAQLRFRR